MKSKASFFKVNKHIVVEDFKRFWGIPVLYFLGLFLAGPFPILMTYDTLDLRGYHLIDNILNNETFFHFMFLSTAPLAAAVLIFRYIQQTNSTSVIHSFPFTRKELYISHCFTGIILTIIPVLLNGIILFLIKKPIYQDPLSTVDIFSSAAIWTWVWHSLIIVILGFSVAVFAGVISGTSVLHSIFGFGFLFLLPAIVLLLTFYFDKFIFGFNMTWQTEQFISSLSPIVAKLSNGDFTIKYVIWYLAVTIFMFVISYLLYMKRKLERATDSIAFDFLKPVFKYSVAFCGMTLLGMYFMEFCENKLLGMYGGFFVGSILAYIIAEMIVQKTIWIFRNMKGYLFYLIIAVLFILCIQTDIFGYEKRLPDLDEVSSVYFGYYSTEDIEKGAIDVLTSAENIEAAYQFHVSIIDNKKWLEKENPRHTRNVAINYQNKNGKTFSRQYELPNDFFIHNPYIKQVYESQEYKIATNRIFKSDIKELEYVSIYPYLPSDQRVRIIDPIEIKELFDAIKQDILSESFDNMMSQAAPLGSIDFTWKDSGDEKKDYKYFRTSLKRTSKHTIAWLESKGYMEKIIISPDEITYISIEKYIKDNDYYYRDRIDPRAIPEATSELMVVKNDLNQIEHILKTYEESSYYNEEDGYRVTMVFNNGNTDNGYYRCDTAPQFILDYFN